MSEYIVQMKGIEKSFSTNKVPVSYTHLDVYKRQVDERGKYRGKCRPDFRRQNRSGRSRDFHPCLPGFGSCANAVSYTHLGQEYPEPEKQ